MSKSVDDLWTAFAGESQANRKYLAFAKKADSEGYPQIARLFRAAAHAETVHALAQFRALGEIKTTAENLQTAAARENYEWVTMYPGFIQDAQADDNDAALVCFERAMAVEEVHEKLYREALANIASQPTEVYEYFVCPVCGYTVARNAPERCPICGTLGTRFERIN
jgi:rubrerythrin